MRNAGDMGELPPVDPFEDRKRMWESTHVTFPTGVYIKENGYGR